MNLKLWGYNHDHAILRVVKEVRPDFGVDGSGTTLIRGSSFKGFLGIKHIPFVEIVHEAHESTPALTIAQALQAAGVDVELPPPIRFFEGKR